MNFDVLVIGGGVAGLSTALELANAGCRRTAVLEQEKKLGGHASGNNAGMIRQAVSEPWLVRLAHEGCEGLRGIAGFRSRGSLILAKKKDFPKLKQIAEALSAQKIPFRVLSRGKAVRLVPPLSEGDFEAAFFSPTDAFVNIHALLGNFSSELKRRGVKLFLGLELQAITKEKGGFRVKAGGQDFFAKRIVNAAGAWAGSVGRMAGAAPIPFRAYRRHLFLSAPSAQFSSDWPFVWDITHEFYFRPVDGRRLLLSPCDRTVVSARYMKERKERIDPAMRKILLSKIKSFSPFFRKVRLQEAKSGLRTMTPDGRFIVGEDPTVKGFYWVAGLGGHGVTTCVSVGKLASRLVLGKPCDKAMVKALSPGRF